MGCVCMELLSKIKGHSDLIQLNEAQREQLCREIREYLVSSVSETGGHLASNLGVVELSVALETVFDTGVDRLVVDVGHQSYVHKMLTGRREEFTTCGNSAVWRASPSLLKAIQMPLLQAMHPVQLVLPLVWLVQEHCRGRIIKWLLLLATVLLPAV